MKFVNPKDNIALKPNEKAILKAYWRQGLQELRNTLYQDSRVAGELDAGIWGRATAYEVSMERAESNNLLQVEQEKLRNERHQHKDREKEMEK